MNNQPIETMNERSEILDGPVRWSDRIGMTLGCLGLVIGGAMGAHFFGPWVVVGLVFASLAGVIVWLVAMFFESDGSDQ